MFKYIKNIKNLQLRKPKGDIALSFTNANGTLGLKPGDHIGASDRSTYAIYVIKSVVSDTEAIGRYAQWYDFIWWVLKHYVLRRKR